MWDRIEARCRELKCGRSQYFQMLVDWDLRFEPEIFAHKADGKWHFYPEASLAAEEPVSYVKPGSKRPRSGKPKPGS